MGLPWLPQGSWWERKEESSSSTRPFLFNLFMLPRVTF